MPASRLTLKAQTIEVFNTKLILTGAASIAAGPLLHALLRRRFAAVQLCADLPELADLQAHLSTWCAAQGLPTALQWLAEEPESSSVAPTPWTGWLIHGNTCRAEALLQRNVCTALRPQHPCHRPAPGDAARLRC